MEVPIALTSSTKKSIVSTEGQALTIPLLPARNIAGKKIIKTRVTASRHPVAVIVILMKRMKMNILSTWTMKIRRVTTPMKPTLSKVAIVWGKLRSMGCLSMGAKVWWGKSLGTTCIRARRVERGWGQGEIMIVTRKLTTGSSGAPGKAADRGIASMAATGMIKNGWNLVKVDYWGVIRKIKSNG